MGKKLLLSVAIQQLCCCDSAEAEKTRRILEEEYGIKFVPAPKEHEVSEVLINVIPQDEMLRNLLKPQFPKPFVPKTIGKPAVRKGYGKFFSRKAKR